MFCTHERPHSVGPSFGRRSAVRIILGVSNVTDDTARGAATDSVIHVSVIGHQMMKTWYSCFTSVKEVRANGGRGRNVSECSAASRSASGILIRGADPSVRPATGGPREEGPLAGGHMGTDWWDEVSHQAQRVAHVAAASAFASGGGEVRLSSHVLVYVCLRRGGGESIMPCLFASGGKCEYQNVVYVCV